eukprot:6212888-Pleurochrysis_carterae.AAC.4
MHDTRVPGIPQLRLDGNVGLNRGTPAKQGWVASLAPAVVEPAQQTSRRLSLKQRFRHLAVGISCDIFDSYRDMPANPRIYPPKDWNNF